jgi:type 1 glutamine amidotransferase
MLQFTCLPRGDRRGFLWTVIIAASFLAAPAATLAANGEDGFKPIFNGRDLAGWEGNPKFWSVKDGAMTGQTTADNPTAGNTFIIWRDGLVDDFELRLSYRMVGGNSGIQYRSKDFGNWVVGGYQADFEAGEKYSGILYEERMTRGIMAERGEKVVWGADGKKQVVGSVGDSKEIQAAIKKEDWNEYVIIAQGHHFVHKINGRVTVEVTDNDPAKQVRQGVLALQLHAGPPMTVQFKDIRLKRLKLADRKKVVLTAGTPSHGPGEHEHNAGIQLLHQCLQGQEGVLSAYYLNGWPKDPTAYDNADAILIYCDGGGGHVFVQSDHLQRIGEKVKQGVGIGCVHYAVEVPKDKGGPEFLQWIGGYFETHWSVNPHWFADFKTLPTHPVTRGVQPFGMQDEWYYHMRFPESRRGVTPILSTLPPKETLSRPDGPHSGNPHVRRAVLEDQEAQTVMWCFERPDGGRGFGFTGGHFHKNWGHDDFRKVVLNAIVWMAHAEVPTDGVASVVSPEDLKKNLDPKRR